MKLKENEIVIFFPQNLLAAKNVQIRVLSSRNFNILLLLLFCGFSLRKLDDVPPSHQHTHFPPPHVLSGVIDLTSRDQELPPPPYISCLNKLFPFAELDYLISDLV